MTRTNLAVITDIQHQGELDILSPVKHENLRIVTLEGKTVYEAPAPLGGWTHAALVEHVEVQLGAEVNDGADAYLGDTWVGSTEI